MSLTPFGSKSLSFFLCLATILSLLTSSTVLAGIPPAISSLQKDRPDRRIAPTQRGLEKLAPDLQDAFEQWQAQVPGMPGSLALDEPLLVSALIYPETEVGRLFLRSALSRPVAGVQWITGEIRPAQLGKLASLAGVLSVISAETYQPEQAPGLADLRTGGPHLTVQEMRALLQQGGPAQLRAQIDRVKSSADVGRQPADPLPVNLAEEGPAPGLLEIHDVIRAHERGYTGEGVVVAIVDTGVDFSHPDLQGTQAVIQAGPYAGWPFAYDVLSGAYYAIDTSNVIHPYDIWKMIGVTQYVTTMPVSVKVCALDVCAADLYFVEEEAQADGLPIRVTWPNTSKSGSYFYSAHPDLLLAFSSYYLHINYAESALMTPVVVVSDENSAGVYDTVYVDMNYNYFLGDPGERLTRAQPLGGTDLTGDGTWDLSAGMLAWISDGVHHPPGVATLYPEIEALQPPGTGRLLAFINDQDGHGTNCASEVAGQGRMMDPEGLGPTNPLYAGAEEAGGVGGAVIRSMAPDARMAAFQNGFRLPLDSWTLAVLGMDGIAHSGDEAQIVSNSWGDSRTIEDGWDATSRFAQKLSQEVAEDVAFLAATGNGGHGYGTVTSPGGGSIIDVGASTAYGALLAFEFVDQGQYQYGHVQPWSNRGPGALGDIAPDVTAVGAWGPGAQPLNSYFGNGQAAYDIFGGTSMSTPVAAGNLALIYQAFYSQPENQRWPTWQEARSLLLGSAQDLGYDRLTQGSGNVQAGRAIDRITGLEAWAEPAQWQAGEDQGQEYPEAPALLFPGSQDQQEITVHNPTGQRLVVSSTGQTLRKVHEETFSVSFIPPPPGSNPNQPVFLQDVTGLIEAFEPDLVRAQVSFPYDRFDLEGDGYVDNWWSVSFYDWLDRNADGNLWQDTDQNGLVNEGEIDIDSATGLYEYNRFTYGYPQSTVLQASLGGPGLARRHDGVFLGLLCYYCGHSMSLQVKVSLYQEAPWDWLEVPHAQLVLEPYSTSSLTVRLSVPEDTLPGVYDGVIELDQGDEKMRIPVVGLVAADTPTFAFGGVHGPETPYDNGELFGGFNWEWRYEAGDWRFFYYDFPDGTAGAGKVMVVDTRWDTPQTDLDTWVFGVPSPDLPGAPGAIDLLAGSADTYLYNGRFAWQTNTGDSAELVGVPFRDGLGMIALHNVLSSGVQLAERFVGQAYQVSTSPAEISVDSLPDDAQTPFLTASQNIVLTSTGDIPEGIQVRAYGFSTPVDLPAETAYQDAPPNICSASWIYRLGQGGLLVENAGLLDISTHSESEDLDLDLFLFRDDGDGKWNCSRDDLETYSINADAEEQIKIYFPLDGRYWVTVLGNTVPEGRQPFDFRLRLYQGAGIMLRDFPVGPIQANQAVNFTTIMQSAYTSQSPAPLEGLLLVGPPADPMLLEIPLQLRPTILIYPQPVFGPATSWIRQEPVLFTLSFQNQGVLPELMEVEIEIPEGLVYVDGTASAPDTPPTYDPSSRRLTWTGTAGSGAQVILTFQATGQTGVDPAWVSVPARVVGQTSGQEWLVEAKAGVNLYGQLLPVIRR